MIYPTQNTGYREIKEESDFDSLQPGDALVAMPLISGKGRGLRPIIFVGATGENQLKKYEFLIRRDIRLPPEVLSVYRRQLQLISGRMLRLDKKIPVIFGERYDYRELTPDDQIHLPRFSQLETQEAVA